LIQWLPLIAYASRWLGSADRGLRWADPM